MVPDTPSNHLELVKAKKKESQGQRATPPNSPGVLKHIEESALSSCRQLVEHMFASTDDLFYELSKRASSNNEQNLYFESMREIRIKKEGLIISFLQSLSFGFKNLVSPEPAESQRDAVDQEVTLSIVEGDDLEIELALKSMSNRARDSYKGEVYELIVRLDHLLLQTEVNEDNNPIDPLQIAKAFVKSCVDKLSISIKTRLILFKLFEKHVLKQLGPIYSDANQTLIETGILPKVPKSLVKTENDGSTSTATEQENKTGEERSPQQQQASRNISLSPEALATLMSAIRTAAQTMPQELNYYVYTRNPGPVVNAKDLAAILTSKQPVVDHKMARSEPKVVLRDLVNELLAKNNPKTPNSVNQSDEDTINLVSLFFDKILEEKNLPLIVQSIICRLQIPLLKVALRDPSFLTNNSHPARKLINTVTNAGLQFDLNKPLERDPLYRTIVDGIQTINRQYSADDSVFEIVQSQLEELLRKESRRSNLVESRTAQTEMGKAKIRNAKAFAQSTLFDKMKDEKLPELISEFLTNTWLQVLVITYIKEGKEGALWVENEQLISDLIWLCKSHKDERSKARAQRLKPEILARIEKGLELAIDNPETRKARIEEIEETIEAIVASGSQQPVEFRPLDNKQKQSLGKSEGATKSWDEMTALERQQSKYEELSSKYYLEAKNIAEGTWVEFNEADAKVLRCKLSKKIDAESYIFVNRFGFKSIEKSRRQLAYDMQCSKAKIIDNTPIFDRILDGIISRFHSVASNTA